MKRKETTMSHLGFWSVRDQLTRILALAEEAEVRITHIQMPKSQLTALREGPGLKHPQILALSGVDLGVAFLYNGHTTHLRPSTGGPERA